MRNVAHLFLIRRRFSPSAMLISAAAILLCLLWTRSPRVLAAGTGGIISWDSSMIYAGQNNGNPWGPVGEHAIVHGANFVPGVQLNIILAHGNSNGNPSVCKAPVATAGTVTTSATGTFLLSFIWPSQAGSVNSMYSICSVTTSGGVLVSNRDGGSFTVLSSGLPSFSVSPNSVQPGSAITISGQNWVPPQQVTISITGGSQLLNETQNSSGLNSGTFSITYTVPASTQGGSYAVNVSASSVLSASSQNLSVAVPATPTPTPTATATPTATDTVTPTGTAAITATAGTTNTPTGASSNSGPTNTGSSGGGPSLFILGILGAIALVLLTSIGLIVFMVMSRSPQQKKGPAIPGNAPGAIAYRATGGLSHTASGWQPQQTGSPNLHSQATMAAPADLAPAGPRCMNCGRPLATNAARCDACGTQTGLYPGW